MIVLTPVKDIIRQDMKVAVKTFLDEDFGTMNILSNRFMANLVFDSSLKNYAIVGHFLKEIAQDYLKIQPNKPLFKKNIHIGKKYVKKLKETIDRSEFIVVDVWNIAFAYKEDINNVFAPINETETYNKNIGFVDLCFEHLLNVIETNRDVLLVDQNAFLNGLLNEIDRIIRVHGMKPYHFAFKNLIQSFGRLYDYIRFSSLKMEGGFDKTIIQEGIKPYIDKMINFGREKKDSSSEDLYLEATDFMSDTILEWRKNFILFMDMGRIQKPTPKRIELPEEARKSIMEAISKDLEKDVGKE